MGGEVQLPPPFDPDGETVKFLARAKKKASKNFKPTRSKALVSASDLAFWLHIFGRDEEAFQVCEFLYKLDIAEEMNLWSPVEPSVALRARLLREGGDSDGCAQCVERIRNMDFVVERLEGVLLEGCLKNVKYAVEDRDKTRERNWRLGTALEQCVLIELGGSDTLPVDQLESEFKANFQRLQELVGADIGK